MPVELSRVVVPRIPGRWQRFRPAASWQEAQRLSVGYEALDAATTASDTAFLQPLSGNALATIGAFGVALSALKPNAQAVRVIDFGGFDGRFFTLVQSAFKEVPIDWTVVDLPHVVERFSKLGNTGISYVHDFDDELARGADIIFASAALNYVPDPWIALASMFQHCRVVILTRVPLWPIPRHQTAVQRAQRDPEISYPTWFFSEAQIFSQVNHFADVLLDFECPNDRASFMGHYSTYRGLVLCPRAPLASGTT